MSLYVYTDNVQLRNMMRDQIRRPTDSGFDVPMLGCDVNPNSPVHTFALGIQVAAVDANNVPVPCLLIPRSSISGTPYRLSNSIGLIDAGYRGEVKAKVDVKKQSKIHYINFFKDEPATADLMLKPMPADCVVE